MTISNFSLEEFLHSDTANQIGASNYPTWDIVDNLRRLADVLDQIRTLCGDKPVLVSSGYRCPEVNAAVGGVSDSAHVYGLAADITIPEFGTPTQICDRIKPHLAELQIDQAIDESGGGARWLHVGLCAPPAEPRCECFRIG